MILKLFCRKGEIKLGLFIECLTFSGVQSKIVGGCGQNQPDLHRLQKISTYVAIKNDFLWIPSRWATVNPSIAAFISMRKVIIPAK